MQSPAPAHLTIRPRGDGVTVPRDGTGTRVAVTVNDGAGERWTIHRTLLGGNAFSAHNGFQLSFGLGEATMIEEVAVWWSDGHRETFTDIDLNSVQTLSR